MTDLATTETERTAVLNRYADREITAEHAADLLGPGVAVADVVIETARRLGRLPDERSAFTEAEFKRGLVLLGLDPNVGSAERRL